MIAKTKHDLVVCTLKADEVPILASEIQVSQDEPFGGLPTIAYSNVFKRAREHGVTVLLDGNGMDEQWAGYDYYLPTTNVHQPSLIQGTKESPVKPNCLLPEFRNLTEASEFPSVFSDGVRNLQYRDTRYTKIPKVLRFNDRISMKYSTELREPFLDHRLFELAFRQPIERKINNGTRKAMLRKIASGLIPDSLTEAPKRPLQTPQREWLRRELRDWADQTIETALDGFAGNWLDRESVKNTWSDFCSGKSDNSFYVWQWISIGLMASTHKLMPVVTEGAY
jgi:asparagine synthase (glutamine-hydrolysing)